MCTHKCSNIPLLLKEKVLPSSEQKIIFQQEKQADVTFIWSLND